MAGINVVWKQLFHCLKPKMQDLGYKGRETDGIFYRDYSSGVRQFVHLACSKWPGKIHISGNASVRFHRVEELVQSYLETLTPRERKLTATLGATFGELMGQGWHYYSLDGDKNTVSVANVIVDDVKEVAQPFLNVGFHDLSPL